MLEMHCETGDGLTGCHRCLQVWIVLLALSPTLSGHQWGRSARMAQFDETAPSAPEFRQTEIKEVDSVVGQMVLLPCTVTNLGDRVVSWIRKKDLHILTSGPITFSADSRFESVHSSNRDFWGLRIRGARIADTGQYECQVNTDPKMSFAVNLTVTDKSHPTFPKYLNKATILGPRDLFVREGTPVILTCEISPLIMASSQSSLPKFFFPTKARVQWFHGENEVKLETERGEVSVDTDYTDRKVISRLKISMVTPADGGTYTCKHPSSQADSSRIFVVQTESEHAEVMQKDYPPRPLMASSSGVQAAKIQFLPLYIVLVIALGVQ